MKSTGLLKRRDSNWTLRGTLAYGFSIAVAAILPFFHYAIADLTDEDAKTFLPGGVSTEDDEERITFTPDAKTCVFSRAKLERNEGTLYVLNCRDNVWGPPTRLAFSGAFDDRDPMFSPDGSRLFFASKRPGPGDRKDNGYDIWYVSFDGTNWGDPMRLGGTVNSHAHERWPSLTKEGRLYFCSWRENGPGRWDIYESTSEASLEISRVQILGKSVNTKEDETDAFVDSDGSRLFFSRYHGKVATIRLFSWPASRRFFSGSCGEGNPPEGRYICMSKREKSGWSDAVILGPQVNDIGNEWTYAPFLREADDTFFFCASQILGSAPRPVRREWQGRRDVFTINRRAAGISD